MSEEIADKMLGDVFSQGKRQEDTRQYRRQQPATVLQTSEFERSITRNPKGFLSTEIPTLERPDFWVDFALAIQMGWQAYSPDMSITGWTEVPRDNNTFRPFRPTATVDDAMIAALHIAHGCAVTVSVNTTEALCQIKLLDKSRYLHKGNNASLCIVRCVGKILNNQPEE